VNSKKSWLWLDRWFGLQVVLGLFAFGLAPSRCLPAQDAAGPFSKAPYLQAPGRDTMTIMWESLTNHPGTVRFGLADHLDQRVDAVAPRRMNNVWTVSVTNVVSVVTNSVTITKTNVTSVSKTNFFYLYAARLKDLQPAATYSYAVELDRVETPPRRFKTFPSDPETVRFIAYGDSRSEPRTHAKVASQFRAHTPDFILHTGDLVARGKDYGLWAKEFFTPLATVIDEVPFFPVIGNHEEDGTNYLGYFHLPGQGRWYSFELGPVHVLALDFHFEKGSSEQFQFARQDLLSTRAAWKIVVVHYPVFNIGGHATGWGHADYLPLFHQAKVDLVIAGHSHVYERFRPVAPIGAQASWPITCITTGGGGARLYPSFDHPALFVRKSANHYMAFEATRDTLQARAILANGTLIDRLELHKVNGQLPPDYLAQVYPEESLKLFFEIAPSLVGRATALPSRAAPATVNLTLPPRKQSPQPAELEISLMPGSRRYYRLENAPLRALMPPKGQTNTVWAKVRATGRKKIIEDKDHNLSPALVFQAHVKAADGETVVYGVKSQLSRTAAEPGKKP